MENGIEKIKKIKSEVEEKVKKDTEYTVMIKGKWEKFALYEVKDSGRLVLLNTRYGTLTAMSASFFLKLINPKKARFATRPYIVERPEKEVKDLGEIVRKQQEKEGREQLNITIKEMKKWAFRLKTLPLHVEETLEKGLNYSPKQLAEDFERFIADTYDGSRVQLFNLWERAKNLLKGTEWYVK